MDFTSRMLTLLGDMRRERNGLVADRMGFYGAAYGLNYGVSLPTLRSIARAEASDHDFARYLYLQDVRCLRLAALHIARPECVTTNEFAAWGAGIINSEVAEEAAFALLSRVECLPELFRAWTALDEKPLLQYTALMAAARSKNAPEEWVAVAVELVHYHAARGAGAVSDAGCLDAAESVSDATCSSAAGAVSAAETIAAQLTPASSAFVPRLISQGALAFLSAFGAQNEASRQAVLRAADSLGKLPAEHFILGELAWRLNR